MSDHKEPNYIAIWGWLLLLTITEVATTRLPIPRLTMAILLVGQAMTKALLVAMYFMHLKGEKPMVYWPLGLTAFLFIGLLVSVLLAEGDHLFGTQFGDAFTRE